MAETKKSGLRLDADAVVLLDQLAPGYKKGDFVSKLIREAAARQQVTAASAPASTDERSALRLELARLAGELARMGQIAVEMAQVTQQLLALDEEPRPGQGE